MIPFGVFLIGLAFLHYARERDFKTITSAWEKLLEQRDREFEIVADRWYALRNLPPSNVEMSTEYAARQEAQRQADEERKNLGPKPTRIGPIDSATLAMELEHRRKQKAAEQQIQ